jgi:DNA-binding transcriptional regulator YiaG
MLEDITEHWMFTAPQKGLISRMVAEQVDAAAELLTQKIKALKEEIEDIKTDRERREKKLRQKESFAVKDFALLLNVKPETVRKNYIHSGLIEATSVPGKALVISKEEYWRVVDSLDRYGKVTSFRGLK